MKPHRFLGRLLGVALGASSLGCLADEAAKPAPAFDEAKARAIIQRAVSLRAAELRAAINKGLGYLAKEGDAWVAKEKCMACHHLPMITWSHTEAMRRGFAVDTKKMDEWLKWSATYTDAKGGPEVLDLWWLASLPRQLTIPDNMTTAALVKSILATQQSDGSWKPTGRLGKDQRRTASEATEFVTRLTVFSLSNVNAIDDDAAKARARGLVWLKKEESPQSTETLIFRALMARRLGTLEEAGTLFKDLLAQQHPDGGWAWRIGEPTSDAYTTGLALYALHDVKVEHAAEASTRARHWLLAAQRADGAWPVNGSLISAQTGADQLKMIDGIYTTWASGWAVLGLLQGFAVTETK